MVRQQGSTTARRGRPPLAWLDAEALRALPTGTAVLLERTGGHKPRVVGRIVGHFEDRTFLDTTTGEVIVTPSVVRRARIVEALYEPGDPVVKPGVPEEVWRGGVVRCEGAEVLVEQLDGAFVWIPELELEPAETRAVAAPALRRGPVPRTPIVLR